MCSIKYVMFSVGWEFSLSPSYSYCVFAAQLPVYCPFNVRLLRVYFASTARKLRGDSEFAVRLLRTQCALRVYCISMRIN